MITIQMQCQLGWLDELRMPKAIDTHNSSYQLLYYKDRPIQ